MHRGHARCDAGCVIVVAVTRRTAISTICAMGLLAAFGWAGSAFAGKRELLRPPGAQDEGRFLGSCIKCGRCLSSCHLGCIQPAMLADGLVNARTPYLDFKKGPCDFCGACSVVCPTGAIRTCDESEAIVGVAVVDAGKCVSCERCLPACSYEALSWSEGKRLPVVDEARCNGCGACEYVCPSSSLSYFDGDGRRAIRILEGRARR